EPGGRLDDAGGEGPLLAGGGDASGRAGGAVGTRQAGTVLPSEGDLAIGGRALRPSLSFAVAHIGDRDAVVNGDGNAHPTAVDLPGPGRAGEDRGGGGRRGCGRGRRA